MAERPLIGITGPQSWRAPGRLAAGLAILAAGGRPVLLRPSQGEPRADLEAVVITGGSDIDPLLYGGERRPIPPDTQRDAFELAVLSRAERGHWPVLGICRGAQLINVHRGGDLHGDISHRRSAAANRRSLLPRRQVRIRAGSGLAEATGRRALRVNNLHHQAVRNPGDGLEIVALDRDGIVQGIEARGPRFCLGVQWHPEYLTCQAPQRALFRALVAAARA